MRNKKVSVKIEPDGVHVECDKGVTVLEAINEGGLSIRSECGGRQVCGKCRVVIQDPDKCSELTESEKFHLTSEEIVEGYRLACACKLFADTTVIIPEESRIGVREVLVEGVEREVEIEPYVRKILVILEKPTLSDVRSDCRRILDSLNEVYGIDAEFDFKVLSKLPEILRSSDWKVALTLWRDEIIDVESSKAIDEVYGGRRYRDIKNNRLLNRLEDRETSGNQLYREPSDKLWRGRYLKSYIRFGER